MTSNLGLAALEYAEDQFAVFPVTPYGKTPLVQWQRAATTNKEQIKRWWDKWPNANIGLPTGDTGKAGRRIEVLDIDVKPTNNGLWILQERYVEDQLPNAFARVITPSGGYHYWFRALEQPSGKLEGVDFKATGGYVLVPPSVVTQPVTGVASDYMFANLRPVTPRDEPFNWEMLRMEYGPTGTKESQRLGARQYPIHLLAEWMRQEPEGQRNRELFKKSCIAIESGYRDLTPLFIAALQAGLYTEEISGTMQSAARQYGITVEGIGSRYGYGK